MQDDDDIEEEIRRQLAELSENDVKEDPSPWAISSLTSEDFARMLEKSRPAPDNDDSSLRDVELMESVDFYLKHLVGHFDNSQAELMRDCDDVLKQSDDALSKNAVAASTSAKSGDVAAATTDDDEENDDEETKRQLESLKEKFRVDEEKRKERMERERREWIEAERQREEERLSRERELVAERERLDREHKVAMEQLQAELEREKMALQEEQAQHEIEMAQFVQEEEIRRIELKELKEFEEKNVMEKRSTAAVVIQKMYRGFSIRRLMRPLLDQKRRERIRREEEERERKRREAEEEKRRIEEKKRLEEEERRRIEEERLRRKRIEEEEQRERERLEKERLRREEEERLRLESKRREEEAERERRRKEEEAKERRRREEEERRRREMIEERERQERERLRREAEEQTRLEEERIRKERLRLEALERERLEEERRKREEEERLRRERERPEYIAAVRIQAAWRGFVTRSTLWQWLPWLHRRAEREQRRHEAATRLQANFRGYLLRKRLDNALLEARFEDNDPDDDFDYDQEIDLGSFNLDEGILDVGWGPPATPQLPSTGPPLAPIERRSSSPPSVGGTTMPRGDFPSRPIVAWKSSSRTNTPTKETVSGSNLDAVRQPLSGRIMQEEQKLVKQASKGANPWGFKNADTADLMLKRARRLKQGVRMHKKLQDPKTRLALFRKLNDSARDRTDVRRTQKGRGERISYFQHKAHQANSSPSEQGSIKQERADLTYRWVHEHFVAHRDVQASRLSSHRPASETTTTPVLPRINLNGGLVSKSQSRNA